MCCARSSLSMAGRVLRKGSGEKQRAERGKWNECSDFLNLVGIQGWAMAWREGGALSGRGSGWGWMKGR